MASKLKKGMRIMSENILPMLIIFSYSLVLNSMAPLLKSFRELFNISTALSSLLPFFSLSGTVISNIFVGVYISKLGLKRSLIIGSILTIVGTFVVAFATNYSLALIGILIFGLSTGFGFTGGTTLLTLSKNANYGFFHGAYGLGGIIAPFIITIAEKATSNFKNVYYIYAVGFAFLYIYLLFRKIPELKTTEPFNLKQIKNAFRDRNFSLFLILLILYSSAEIGTITWSGSTMRETNISPFISYTLFWLTFTLSRFLVNNLSNLVKNLVRLNSLILLFLVIIFVITKNPVLFSLSGFFFGPIFPYVQNIAINSINRTYTNLFNGSTYAFTSLGGNIVSTLMGLFLDKSLPLSWSIPVIIIFTIYSISKEL